MTYEEALTYIHSVEWLGSKPGLSRTRELLRRLGDPQKRLRFIHVAGTNGKGSVCAMLSSVLQKSGYKTGLYTSPYLYRFNERLQINGKDISDRQLGALTGIVARHAETMADHPTEFELITALGMLWFAQEQCDIVVLETGLGGELDSTNVIDAPELAIITSIGLDHTQYLGETIPQIAQAKAGIIKPGSSVAASGRSKEALAVFRARAEAQGCSLFVPDYDRLRVRHMGPDGAVFDYKQYESLRIALAGSYQLDNAILTVTALDVLATKGYCISGLRSGLAEAAWRGRFEVICHSPTVILDGGHNPQGVAAAVASLQQLYPGKAVHFLVGVMADKDVEHMLRYTMPVAAEYICVTPPNPRALPAGELAERLRRMGCRASAASSIPQGVQRLLAQAGEGGLACCIGSLYMSADVRACFTDK